MKGGKTKMTYDPGTAYNDGYKAGLKNGYKKALAEITNPVNDDLKRADDIICHEFCVTYDDLHRRTRLRHIVEARQMAMYVRRKIFNLSLHQSANDFGLNHATALWAVRQVEVLICNDKLFQGAGAKGAGRRRGNQKNLRQAVNNI